MIAQSIESLDVVAAPHAHQRTRRVLDLTQYFSGEGAEHLPHCHPNAQDHRHWEENHPQNSPGHLRLADQLHRVPEKPSQETDDGHEDEGRQVVPQQQEEQQHAEEDGAEQSKWKPEDGGDTGALMAAGASAQVTVLAPPTALLTMGTALLLTPAPDDVALLVVVAVVRSRPLLAAHVAELEAALAAHVVAASGALDDHLAPPTLSVAQVALKVPHLALIARPLVGLQQALLTKLCLALIANSTFLVSLKKSQTVLFGTRSQLLVATEVCKLFDSQVLLLNIKRQSFEEGSRGLQHSLAAVCWTQHVFKVSHSEDSVMMQARLTEALPVRAVTDEGHLLVSTHLRLTDLTLRNATHRSHLLSYGLAQRP